ncbi:DUF2924 domain-containing protein [Altererythrobacter aurantiacus]|uniref:DUF2924 domain-containing protein n=1 Tax=Parapontixanthobacter aurantiacus TaxID=1463599 RepID=A0A844ZG84_9SPHN|nr:DUF2924 domain-containing protein [Parapontixanthobacter aurantiacus]MXO85990.1 DUF2924 domain-containing protein [Parapontixanthobacter aurantiacus]
MKTNQTDAGLSKDLAALEDLSLEQLRVKWATLTCRQIPRISAVMLRMAIARELQIHAFGGLSQQAEDTLDRLAQSKLDKRNTTADVQLRREWNGNAYIVTIDNSGTIHWNGQRWHSLSAVARQITGTRWSGPAFFGLRQKGALDGQ